MLLETKEQQLIGYFCNYFVDLKTLLDNKDKLNLTEECVKIIENKLENGPKTINKYLPYGELFDQLYPLYEKNHKMELDPDDLESVKKFKEEFDKKYDNYKGLGDGEQDDFYKNLLSNIQENHGLTKEEVMMVNEEDETKVDYDALERIHEKEEDICDLVENFESFEIRLNLNNRIFNLKGGAQKTRQELFPDSYEIFCELASLGKEICTEDFFEQLKLKNPNPEFANIFRYSLLSPTRNNSIEKNLSIYYPEKRFDQIEKDCSKIILGEEKRKEITHEKFKRIYNFIKNKLMRNLPMMNVSQKEFYRFCNIALTVARLMIIHC